MPYKHYSDKLKHNRIYYQRKTGKTYYQEKTEGINIDRKRYWMYKRLQNLIEQGVVIPEIEEE